MCTRSGYSGEDSTPFLDDTVGLRTPPTLVRKRNMQSSGLAAPKAMRLTSAGHSNLLQRLEASSPISDLDGLLCDETEFESQPATPAQSYGEKLAQMPRRSQEDCVPVPVLAKRMSRVGSLNQWMGRANSGTGEEPEIKTPDPKHGRRPGPAYHLEPPLECSESAQVESDTDHDMTEGEVQGEREGTCDGFVEQLYTAFCQQIKPPAACTDKYMVAFGKLVAWQMQAAQAGCKPQAQPQPPNRQHQANQAATLKKKGSFSFS